MQAQHPSAFAALLLFALGHRVIAEQTDWLQSGIVFDPPMSGSDAHYHVVIGMTDQSDCSDIGPRTKLTLYVGPNTTQTCQGWHHCKSACPDTSNCYNDSAIQATCFDGGISYTQTWPIGFNYSAGEGMKHHDYNGKCVQGWPTTVYTQILDFSGCLKQGFSPNVTHSSECFDKCD